MQQSHAALKVGTDAMILGASASFVGCSKLLDIGTGTGVLALMQAQKNNDLDIHGIEIDTEACKDAVENFKSAKFPNDFRLYNGDFLDFEEAQKFDAFICNPPFYENTLKGDNEALNTAKHLAEMSLKKLIVQVSKLAEEMALFWVIWPSSGQEEMTKVFQATGWNCVEEILVYGKPNKAVRTISAWTNQDNSTEVKQSELLIRNEKGEYSEAYKALTKDFHDRVL